MPNLPEIPETGKTFRENAVIKVRAAFDHQHKAVIAEDSGLEIFSLNRRPGVYSSRFSGIKATDASNNAKLLRLLRRSKQRKDRRARYICVIAFFDGTRLKTFRGVMKGTIAFAPRGSGGFGYDPLFYYRPLGGTFGEIPLNKKQTVSHRSRAFKQFLNWLKTKDKESLALPHVRTKGH